MSFDRLASAYRTLETLAFGAALQRCRTALLEELQSARQILIVGEGNGRFLVELLRVNPEAQVVCLDSSQRMIGLAQARVRQERPDDVARVQFLCQSIAEVEFENGRYDGLVTNFFLDCFETSLPGVIAKIAQSATADATWLISDFRIPERGFGRWEAGFLIGVMYRFFRVFTRIEAARLTSWESSLHAHGFQRRRRELLRHGTLTSELWKQEKVKDIDRR